MTENRRMGQIALPFELDKQAKLAREMHKLVSPASW